MSTATVTAAQMQQRARRLRSLAVSLHPVVAETYRRRAAELDIEALLEAVWNPPIDMGDTPADDTVETGGAGGVVVRSKPLHLAVA